MNLCQNLVQNSANLRAAKREITNKQVSPTSLMAEPKESKLAPKVRKAKMAKTTNSA